MSRKEIFLIRNLIIAVDDGSYLIEVDRSDEQNGIHSVTDLPAWTLQSRYAIWLSAGEAPIRIRALEGEQIKQQLLKTLHLSSLNS